MRLLIALVAALALAGCGMASGQPDSIAGKTELVVGVPPDEPGLGLRGRDGTFTGLDIDVARYIAARLGAANVTFKAVTSGQREDALRSGEVDMIVSSYSITPERKTKVTFAGPYYVAHQDTLVRSSEPGVRNVRDLSGRRLCQVRGSVSWQRVTIERKVPARLVPADSYGACLDDLVSGTVDAISTDDLILAGFAAEKGHAVQFVNAPFSDEKYGVGVRPGDLDGCEDVNKAITEMYQDHTAAKLLKRWFGMTTLRLTTTVPQFEGCS